MDKTDNIKYYFVYLDHRLTTTAIWMKKMLSAIYRLYADGFRNMTVGKTLWAVIVVKLAVIFLVLKLFFFHDFISDNAQKGKEPDFVSAELQKRMPDN